MFWLLKCLIKSTHIIYVLFEKYKKIIKTGTLTEAVQLVDLLLLYSFVNIFSVFYCLFLWVPCIGLWSMIVALASLSYLWMVLVSFFGYYKVYFEDIFVHLIKRQKESSSLKSRPGVVDSHSPWTQVTEVQSPALPVYWMRL